MDIYARIRQDHDRLRSLLDRLQDGGADPRLADELKRELWAHGKVEEVVFYDAVAHAGKARAEALEGLNEHHLINTLVNELNAMSGEGTAWKAKVQVLGEQVRHHIDEEEEELFEEARAVIGQDRAEDLGRAFDERKALLMRAVAPMPKA